MPKSRKFKFVSLFSGGGFGDYGLKLAGGDCIAACEIDPTRATVHKVNINAKLVSNICTDKTTLYNIVGDTPIDLLIATPPCQSFSTANAKRGSREDPDHASRDSRNSLFFEALSVAHHLKPTFIFFENVPNFLERKVKSPDGKHIGRVKDFLAASLTNYVSWADTICLSTLGVPQTRRRSLALFVRKDFLQNAPSLPEQLQPINWPMSIDDMPKNIIDALAGLEPLDGKCIETANSKSDLLHQVPVYDPIRYRWISSIPINSNKSAWENACPACGFQPNRGLIECDHCNSILTNRPHVRDKEDAYRLIKGFKTSYKRMSAQNLAPTITTTSGAFSSDQKLHPNQNRVLSPRECARLQTIPDTFKWPEQLVNNKAYRFREMIGEAIPSLVTYRLGKAISRFIISPSQEST